MKKSLVALAIALCLTVSVTAQAKVGPIVDKVIFDVRMDRAIGIKDTAAGKTDLFMFGLDGKDYKAISAEDKKNLDVYAIPSGSWSLIFNPIPNKAPYTVTKPDGVTEFNPFAIREVRFAMNILIDRKKIVDEILLGDGEPMFTPMTPGQPGTYKYNLIGTKLGFSARGNEKKAIADIEAAMQAASKLPENAGKLVKSGQFWNFNGKPVTIKLLARADDPNGRILEGRYVADQIEKAGIKVEKLEYDRAKCFALLWDDPAKYEYNIYTEGWGAGATRAWWDVTISQMYAPYYTNMPGWGESGYWQYENPEIDRLAEKGINGWFLTADEYWRDNLKATELGMKESVRIYVASQLQYYVANKARFNARMLYGLGDGLNDWSIKSADVKANDKGEKVLRATQFSARGSLFMSAWDPVGTDGFSDTYSANIISNCYDPSTFESPNSAKDTALRAKWDPKKVETKVGPGADGKPVGLIPVDPKAMIFNSKTKKWVTGVEYKDVGDGKMDYVPNAAMKSYTKATTTYLYGKFHSGAPVTIADLMYATYFTYEWANQDSPDDKYYSESYASQYQSSLPISKGTVLNADGSFTSFYDFNWPMDFDRVASTGVQGFKAGNPGRQTGVSFEIYEALAKLVVEGGKSGTAWSFSTDKATTEVDIINPKCVADIKAKLEEMKAAKYVPAAITQWLTPDQAVARYDAAIKFIEKYGNAYISNGPFFISKVDFDANYIELSAFRDPAYPYKSDYWPKAFKTDLTRIDDVKVPATAQKTKDQVIDIAVSKVVYPLDTAAPADNKAKVSVTLVVGEGNEKVYPAKFVKAGSFQVTIPAKDLGALKSGSYTLVVQSNFAAESPSVTPATLVLF